MTSPRNRSKQNPPSCRLKAWCMCLVIAAVPLYAMTLFLFLIGSTATDDPTISSTIAVSSATTTHQLSSVAGTAPPTLGKNTSLIHDNRNNRQSSSTSSTRQSYSSIAREIAQKWNLTAPEAPYLLEQQFYRINDYNPQTDFLHFHHIPKTGGTTVSDIMNTTVGSLVDGHRGILPGSLRSGPFRPKSFYELMGIIQSPSQKSDIKEKEYPYLASYAHTRLRPIHGPNKTDLAAFFEEYFALPNNTPRRLRSLAMLREPMNVRASNQAMAMCALNGLVNTHNFQRQNEGLEPICTPEQGLNISALWDGVVEKAMAKCPNGTFPDEPIADKYDRMLCRRGRSAMDYCRSPTQLLSSVKYKFGMRSMLKGLMARYTAQQQMDLYDYYSDYNSVEEHLERSGLGFSVEKVEEYTLIDLGGLDSGIMHTAYNGYSKERSTYGNSIRDNPNESEPDFLWFGITERMKESTCLFSYTLNVKPLKEPPRQRVMNCSPTSWWTEDHREEVKRKEPADYAVWRVANAILDVRMMKMQEDIRQKLENVEGLAQTEKYQYRALAEAGCLD